MTGINGTKQGATNCLNPWEKTKEGQRQRKNKWTKNLVYLCVAELCSHRTRCKRKSLLLIKGISAKHQQRYLHEALCSVHEIIMHRSDITSTSVRTLDTTLDNVHSKLQQCQPRRRVWASWCTQASSPLRIRCNQQPPATWTLLCVSPP